MNLNLKGKTAFVCGSTAGIGRATAEELARMGANIVLIARNEVKLEAVRKNLDTTKGQTHHYLKADFSFPPELKVRIEQFMSEIGPAHILVNNTGGPPGGAIMDAKPDEFYQAFQNHLICNHILATCLVQGMKEEGYGRIINVISTSVKQPIPGLGVSNTIRGAVANWSKTLAGEVGQYNITVNNVLPGATNTDRLKSIMEAKAKKTGKEFNEVQVQIEAAVPMKRVASPEEIANVIAFLASPAASYVNGINVPVDGGRTACL